MRPPPMAPRGSASASDTKLSPPPPPTPPERGESLSPSEPPLKGLSPPSISSACCSRVDAQCGCCVVKCQRKKNGREEVTRQEFALSPAQSQR